MAPVYRLQFGLDGHLSDPHLREVVETLPAVPANPLLLVEPSSEGDLLTGA
jgi:hypothetical protein